ncbi:UNVERIFIED_CONTAM: hypothetical protein GTU68_015205 [Idotea baltica]|nr:hypothetical protein [Idotea baltica]
MLTDSHCHLDRLDLTRYDGSLDKALDHARSLGVSHFLCIGLNCDNTSIVQDIAERYHDVECSVGIHPLDIGSNNLAVTYDWLVHELQKPHVIAVGETGLDYYNGTPEQHQKQQELFGLHLDAAKKAKKPVIVHTRNAREDTLKILQKTKLDQAGVLHCFTEDWAMAESALDIGFYISISGIVTFRNADKIREVVKKIPFDRLLLETDSPYLAPVPYRGKPNVPGYVSEVAKYIALLRDVTVETLAEQTTSNFKALFKDSCLNHPDA